MLNYLVHRICRLITLLACLHLAILPMSANAGVGSAMSDFIDDSGGAMNITGPSAFNGQSSGYYTMGGVWTRFPQKTTNLASLALPHARGGCGGIDLFTGSFSFINAGELVAMMKAIANNALGFAFQLAIEAISPQIAKTMNDLRSIAERMNNLNINSCETAQALVSPLFGKGESYDQQLCEMVGRVEGIFSDAAKAKHDCGSGGQRSQAAMKTADPASPYNPGDTLNPYNYTWEVLKKSNYFKSGGVLDEQYAEYVMTLVGTWIRQPPTSSGGVDSPGKLDVIPGEPDGGLVDYLLDGSGTGAAKYKKCDEPVKCLNLTSATLPSLAATQSIKGRVNATLTLIETHLRTDAPFTAAEKAQVINLVNGATLPVYKIMAVYSATGGISSSDKETLTEIVSVDLLLQFIDKAVSEASKSVGSFSNANEGDLQKWRDSLYRIKQAVDAHRQKNDSKVQTVMEFIQQTQFLESTLASRLSPGMSASLDWSRLVSRGS
jgi:conjugative transfer pilus assembly protein TraH